MPKISCDKTTKDVFVVSCKIIFSVKVKQVVRTKVKYYVQGINTHLEYVSLSGRWLRS